MATGILSTSCYITEPNNRFLALFPHRHDYIWAEHPQVGESPQWQTESRHPLSDRLIQQGAYLYGVRFGSTTRYCMVDIDRTSQYHPTQDPLAIDRLMAALEPIGLVSAVTCTSSSNGGIHLYFPFEQAQRTWELALVLQALLENAGFKLALGHLELFPNARHYSTNGIPNLYNAHRLPMQAGSYLLVQDLDQRWQPIKSSSDTFVRHWQFAQARNDLDVAVLRRTLKSARRRRYSLSGRADKFLNDLNAEIELGWTDHGQTNRLLGRIALRGYVFGHLLYNCQPLEGDALVAEIVRVARSLPGYTEWCRHQHEIEQRAQEWASCVENSHYFHMGQTCGTQINADKGREPTPGETGLNLGLSWNQQRSLATREKIRAAIADLLIQNNLPATTTARFHALTSYGIGGSTLYRHRDLWHPAHLQPQSEKEQTLSSPISPLLPPVENFPVENIANLSQQVSISADGAMLTEFSPSLLAAGDGNVLLVEGLHPMQAIAQGGEDGNVLLGKGAKKKQSLEQGIEQGIENVRRVVRDIREQQQQQKQTFPLNHNERANRQRDRATELLRRRMLAYLRSGDPILVLEARAWLRSLPEWEESCPQVG